MEHPKKSSGTGLVWWESVACLSRAYWASRYLLPSVFQLHEKESETEILRFLYKCPDPRAPRGNSSVLTPKSRSWRYRLAVLAMRIILLNHQTFACCLTNPPYFLFLIQYPLLSPSLGILLIQVLPLLRLLHSQIATVDGEFKILGGKNCPGQVSAGNLIAPLEVPLGPSEIQPQVLL